MQRWISRQHRANIQVGLVAVQIRKNATRLRNNDRQGCDIENIYIRFDNGLDFSRRQQVLMIKIAVTANPIRTRNDLPKF